MSYDTTRLLPYNSKRVSWTWSPRNEKGYWVNAADMNQGGAKNFILGPYKPGYELGTHGTDLKTNTVWAIINYAGDFAAAGFKNSKNR